jgi:hypothetical protein
MGHHRAIKDNAEYIESELSACSKDLTTIYDGVATHLKSLPKGSDRRDLASNLDQRLPAIRKEIQGLGLRSDSQEVLGSLEQAIHPIK